MAARVTVICGFLVSLLVTAAGQQTFRLPSKGSMSINAHSGFILSSNFPNSYPHNSYAYVTFNIPNTEGKYLKFEALAFEVESPTQDSRCLDSLSFTATLKDRTQSYGPFCGIDEVYFPKTIIESTKVRLIFKSDSSVAYQGFRLQFTVIDALEPTPVAQFECGKPAVTPCLPTPSTNPSCRNRIVGGMEALPGSYPWQVGLVSPSRPNAVFCGGTLVHPCWIITAAHCVRGDDASTIAVRVGSHRMSEKRQVLRLKDVVPHPSYNMTNSANDIALLQLDTCVKFNTTVRPACVSKPSDLSIANKLVVITGWGRRREEGQQPDPLLEAQLNAQPYSKCQQSYGVSKITASMMCASAPGKDTCQGDSGGPLVFRNPNGSYRLAGVTSWGYGCARPGYPGIYTSISYFYDWLRMYVSNI